MARPITGAASTVALLVILVVPAARAGGLRFVAVERQGVSGVDGIHQDDAVAVSPDGGNVYVAGRNDDAVGVFTRSPADGTLTFLERDTNNTSGIVDLRQPTGVTVSPGAAHVYVTSGLDDAVVAFSRGVGGALTFIAAAKNHVGGITGLSGPSAVTLSSDGFCAYATGELDDAVVVFSRNVITGVLTFVESQQEGVGGVDGIGRPTGVAVSPDGGSVYVAGQGADSVAVFSRNPATCALTFVEAQFDGVGGVDGIGRASAVAVSGDSRNVYVTGEHDNGVAAFSRDGGTGALTFIGALRDGKRGVHGIKGARSVVVSPDGGAVYVAGDVASGIGFFHRDPVSGGLSFYEDYRDGVLGFDGLERAFAIAMSVDGHSLYSAARGENAVGVFSADFCGDGSLGADEQCDDGNAVSGDGCSDQCRLELCPPAPLGGCLAAHARGARVTIKTPSNPHGSQVAVSWRGDGSTPAALGDPTTTTDYLLCVYDASGAQPRLTLAAPRGGTCKGRPCWSALPTQVRYGDAEYTPDGVSSLRVASGSTSVYSLSARREHVLEEAAALPLLPLTGPLTLQLVNSAGKCWSATFSTLMQSANEAKATSD